MHQRTEEILEVVIINKLADPLNPPAPKQKVKAKAHSRDLATSLTQIFSSPNLATLSHLR